MRDQVRLLERRASILTWVAIGSVTVAVVAVVIAATRVDGTNQQP